MPKVWSNVFVDARGDVMLLGVVAAGCGLVNESP